MTKVLFCSNCFPISTCCPCLFVPWNVSSVPPKPSLSIRFTLKIDSKCISLCLHTYVTPCSHRSNLNTWSNRKRATLQRVYFLTIDFFGITLTLFLGYILHIGFRFAGSKWRRHITTRFVRREITRILQQYVQQGKKIGCLPLLLLPSERNDDFEIDISTTTHWKH